MCIYQLNPQLSSEKPMATTEYWVRHSANNCIILTNEALHRQKPLVDVLVITHFWFYYFDNRGSIQFQY